MLFYKNSIVSIILAFLALRAILMLLLVQICCNQQITNCFRIKKYRLIICSYLISYLNSNYQNKI